MLEAKVLCCNLVPLVTGLLYTWAAQRNLKGRMTPEFPTSSQSTPPNWVYLPRRCFLLHKLSNLRYPACILTLSHQPRIWKGTLEARSALSPACLWHTHYVTKTLSHLTSHTLSAGRAALTQPCCIDIIHTYRFTVFTYYTDCCLSVPSDDASLASIYLYIPSLLPYFSHTPAASSVHFLDKRFRPKLIAASSVELGRPKLQ